MRQTFEGGCACGEIRYRLTSEPMFVNCCHCTECQRQTGSAFAVIGVIETDRIELLSGTPVPREVPTASGDAHDIYRCPNCQTAVWSDYGRRPALRFVRIGTLDDPGALPPRAYIFLSTSLPWFSPPAGVPAFQDYYDMEAVWPADSLARRRAIGC